LRTRGGLELVLDDKAGEVTNSVVASSYIPGAGNIW
jgi:hypothetical protein